MCGKTIGMTVTLLTTALVVGGCSPAGPTTYDVRGKVTNNGQPLAVKRIGAQKIGGVQVWLVKEGTNPPEQKQATVQDDGTFVFEGDNKPAAGKYKVCVKWQENYPIGPDKLGGKFDEKNSKVYRSIPEDKEINIDVSRPAG